MSDKNTHADDMRLLLRRLLGDGGPELGCDECFALLDEYVELELGETSADEAIPAMSAHLEGCSACREEHDSLLALLRGEARRVRS